MLFEEKSKTLSYYWAKPASNPVMQQIFKSNNVDCTENQNLIMLYLTSF